MPVATAIAVVRWISARAGAALVALAIPVTGATVPLIGVPAAAAPSTTAATASAAPTVARTVGVVVAGATFLHDTSRGGPRDTTGAPLSSRRSIEEPIGRAPAGAFAPRRRPVAWLRPWPAPARGTRASNPDRSTHIRIPIPRMSWLHVRHSRLPRHRGARSSSGYGSPESARLSPLVSYGSPESARLSPW